MKNFKQLGDVLTIAAPEAADSGEFLKRGSLYGVAGHAADSGADVEIHRRGVFTLPKATGTAWVVGDELFWDPSAKKFTKDSTKESVRAVAVAAAASDAATGDVLLDAPGGLRMAAGVHTTESASDTVATGLQQVVAVVATFQTDPADANTYVSATIGDQAGAPAAGSFLLKTWKQSGTDPTPIAADAFSKAVNWIAFGI
jgi:predicted RecA/RadA family phage recombinase